MNKIRKVYVVGGAYDYTNWMESKIVDNMQDADLVVFSGGEDVDPRFYNRAKNPLTDSNPFRDNLEIKAFKEAKVLGKHMIGICRGAQLLCVLNGGILVQHQENPSYIHYIETFDQKNIVISSTHHQAAFPFLMPAKKYKVLGWTNNISPMHWGETLDEELNPPKECEVVYYPKFKCLGIQGHPEMLYNYVEKNPLFKISIAYFRDLLDKFMANQIKA